MVLLDDNFTTIVNAVEEGRLVADNIRKFILYAMTGNSGEIWVMLLPAVLSFLSLAMFGDIAIPLLPIQILWINLVTDGLPGLALAMEPAEKNTMSRPPHPPGESFFSRGVGWHIVLFGLLMGLASFIGGMMYWSPEMADLPKDAEEIKKFRTVVFMVITLSQMGHVLAIRSLTYSVFQIGFFSNPLMLLAVALTFVLQFALIYVPSLQKLFHTTALSAPDIGLCLLLSLIVFWSVEAHKWWQRHKLAGLKH
jgi:Ca2+-transporting ATPase